MTMTPSPPESEDVWGDLRNRIEKHYWKGRMLAFLESVDPYQTIERLLEKIREGEKKDGHKLL